jgi:hypothetical protein
VILPSAYNIGPSQMGIGGGAGAATGGGVNGGLDGSMGDGVQVRWDPLAHPTIVEWLSEQQCSGGKQIDSEWLWSSNRAEASRGSRFISIPCQVGSVNSVLPPSQHTPSHPPTPHHTTPHHTHHKLNKF